MNYKRANPPTGCNTLSPSLRQNLSRIQHCNGSHILPPPCNPPSPRHRPPPPRQRRRQSQPPLLRPNLHPSAKRPLLPKQSPSPPYAPLTRPTPPSPTVLTPLTPKATLLSFYQSAHHWFQSSSQRPTCIVEPDTPSDVAVALRIIGETRTPFAVMSGGHASNRGFSSTEGVHVSLRRMSGVVVKDGGVVEVGFGAVSFFFFFVEVGGLVY